MIFKPGGVGDESTRFSCVPNSEITQAWVVCMVPYDHYDVIKNSMAARYNNQSICWKKFISDKTDYGDHTDFQLQISSLLKVRL